MRLYRLRPQSYTMPNSGHGPLPPNTDKMFLRNSLRFWQARVLVLSVIRQPQLRHFESILFFALAAYASMSTSNGWRRLVVGQPPADTITAVKRAAVQ